MRACVPAGPWLRIADLSVLSGGNEMLPALRARDLLRVDPANPIRRYRASALRADDVEGRHDLFQIDFLLLRHAGIFSRQSGCGQIAAADPSFPPGSASWTRGSKSCVAHTEPSLAPLALRNPRIVPLLFSAGTRFCGCER